MTEARWRAAEGVRTKVSWSRLCLGARAPQRGGHTGGATAAVGVKRAVAFTTAGATAGERWGAAAPARERGVKVEKRGLGLLARRVDAPDGAAAATAGRPRAAAGDGVRGGAVSGDVSRGEAGWAHLWRDGGNQREADGVLHIARSNCGGAAA